MAYLVGDLYNTINQYNPGFAQSVVAKYNIPYHFDGEGRIYYDYPDNWDQTLQQEFEQEYQANKDYYDSRPRVTGFKPGNDPGITIDPSGYDLSAQAQSDIGVIRDRAADIYGRDANRFAVDPYDIPATEGFGYDPALADVYTTDASGYFDPTRQQLDYAGNVLDYALDTNGTPLGQAANLQYLAATGQAPSAADLALDRDANALFAQQMAMAARARGSASSGLATMNAQNNAALGYANLLNSADQARAQEMTAARGALAQTGLGIRQGDLAGAQQASSNAQQLYAINNSELQAGQANTAALNQGAQYNTGVSNDALKYSAGAMQSASGANQQAAMDTLTNNANRGVVVGQGDDQLGSDYATKLLTTGEADRSAGIDRERDIQGATAENAKIMNNYDLGFATNSIADQSARRQAEAQKTGAIIGGVGTALGVLGTIASDERMKDVRGKGSPADFSKVKPMKWSYDAESEGAPGTDWLEDGEEFESGMAQQFPKDVVEEGPDGGMRINAQKAMMRAFDALGDAQRRIKQLEARR